MSLVPRQEPEAERGSLTRTRFALAALVLVAVGVRVNNALRYKTRLGFDAVENMEYLRLLMTSWVLPAPEATWSASHPPLFYYLGAGIWRGLAAISLDQATLVVLPLFVSLAGLGTAGLAYALVRRVAPDDPVRAALAAAVLLFLPVHVYMSAMVSEEHLAALWTSLALFAAVWPAPRPEADVGPGAHVSHGRAALVGLFGGLAFLTKLSGCLVLLSVGLAWLLAGLRRRTLGAALTRVAVMGAVAAAAGGWFYLYNLLEYGYLYPQDLSIHAVMFDMPPGERGLLDYLRIPLATFTDPQLLNPSLLRSVWGSTYDTVFFDGHRHFLPRDASITRVGTALTLLGLLPTSAFVVGVGRGVRRALARPSGVDTQLLLLLAVHLAGYVAFTWGNPWFVTLKGSYLLGLSLPFAFYASEVLIDWGSRADPRRQLTWLALGLLAAGVIATFTLGLAFEKRDGAGLPWRAAEPGAPAPASGRPAAAEGVGQNWHGSAPLSARAGSRGRG